MSDNASDHNRQLAYMLKNLPAAIAAAVEGCCLVVREAWHDAGKQDRTPRGVEGGWQPAGSGEPPADTPPNARSGAFRDPPSPPVVVPPLTDRDVWLRAYEAALCGGHAHPYMAADECLAGFKERFRGAA